MVKPSQFAGMARVAAMHIRFMKSAAPQARLEGDAAFIARLP
jgi:hypothetical protein